jgi:hypothetical protein
MMIASELKGCVDRGILARSALVAVAMTILGIGLQVSTAILLGFDAGPPGLGRIAGLTACYLLAGFAFALAFAALIVRLPGASPVGKGIRYAALVVLAVWLSGSINFCAIDFAGGWAPLSRAKLNNYWMDLIDGLNLLAGGLILGLTYRRRDSSSPAPSPSRELAQARPRGLASRIAAGAALLPLLCFAFYSLASLLLPEGLDLSGQRRGIYDSYLFIPLALSGAGTALLYDVLRRGNGPGLLAGSASTALFVFAAYWVPNCLFILLFGFTWQILVDFLLAMAVSLFLAAAVLEAMSRRSQLAPHGRHP